MFRTSVWKDFQVEKLRGTLIPNPDPDAVPQYQTPSKSQYTRWMVNLKKTIGACRQTWIPVAALKLEFKDGEFTPIVNPPAEDHYDTFEFKYVTIQNVIDAGGLPFLPQGHDPQRNMVWGDHCDENYRYIIDSIATFSAQMSTRCIESFPEIFGRLSYKITHPLEGLHEFAMLHREYNAVLVKKDADMGWRKVIRATEQAFEPNTTSIKAWLSKCELAVNEIMTSGVSADTIDQVIVGNCIEKFEQFSEHTSTSAKWVARGIDMQKQHDTKSVTWRVFVSIVTDHINKDLRLADRDSANTTPEKKRKIETPEASNFFSSQYQAFQAFIKQEGGNKPKAGHFLDGRKRFCPICRVHHEDGLDSCPEKEKLEAHREKNRKRFADGGHGTNAGKRPYRPPQATNPRKVDIDPNDKITGFLSAAAVKAKLKEKEDAAEGASERISSAKAKALIAQLTGTIHSCMYSSIVHPVNSTALTVAQSLCSGVQLIFLMWIASMVVLVAITPTHQLESGLAMIGMLMIGFIIYQISAPPIAGHQQIGMMAKREVQMGRLPQAFLTQLQPNDRRGYLDSCASISIWKDADMLHNIRTISPISLTGVNGVSQITQIGDLNFYCKGVDGAYHCKLIEGVLLHTESPVNLVAVDQMSEAGGKTHFGKKASDNFVSFDGPDGEVRLIVEKVHGIHAFINEMPELAESDDEDENDDEESETNGQQMAWMGDVDRPSLE
jgi:hypothetical protein